MTSLQNLSIKTKLRLITLQTCLTALALACTAFLIYEIQSFRRTQIAELESHAQIFAKLSTAMLAFEDAASANEMLNELQKKGHILGAAIYVKGQVFAKYERSDFVGKLPEHPLSSDGVGNVDYGLTFQAGIFIKGDRAGTIFITADSSELHARLWRYGAISLSVFITSSLIAFLLAARLQRTIVGPVRRLSETARTVAERQDYSVRVEQVGTDEIGRLMAAFNQMLERIQSQDAEVREGRERFEIAVSGSRDGIWDWNLATGEMYLSPQGKAMLGYQESELVNRREAWLALIHPDDRPAVDRVQSDYFDGKRDSYELECRMRDRDGNYRWILVRGAALRDAQGKPHRMAGSQTDITERKKAEEDLRLLNERVVETSRLAGMAEVATGVLHNVGNVLNSVNISVTLLKEKLLGSRITHLTQATELFKQHQEDLSSFLTVDPRGKQLPSFLIRLTDHLTTENQTLRKELTGLEQNVQHIKQIVSAQQSHARVYGTLENLEPKTLMEDVIRISSESLERHGITLVKDYAPAPLVSVDRHKVMQILVNLIRNAKQAVEAIEGREKKITVTIASREDGMVSLSVADNGVGIPEENLAKIFRHGFTTKKDGHGFGLHSCSIAAQEMKGQLSIHSAGVNQGAVFTLLLPPAATTLRSSVEGQDPSKSRAA